MQHKSERAAPAQPGSGSYQNAWLGSVGSNLNIAQRIARAQDGEAVFLGESLIGFVVARRVGFDGITAQGHRLGLFNTQGAAARALLNARFPQ